MKSQTKMVDKYQFDEQAITLINGSIYISSLVETVVALHVVLQKRFTLKRISLERTEERELYERLLKEGK